MHFTHEEIPPGSILLRGFKCGEELANVSDFDLTLVLAKIEEGVFEASGALGDMTTEGNVALGLKCLELKCFHLRFKVLKGTTVTRWASDPRFSKLLWSDDFFDCFEIDLQKAAAVYVAEGIIKAVM